MCRRSSCNPYRPAEGGFRPKSHPVRRPPARPTPDDVTPSCRPKIRGARFGPCDRADRPGTAQGASCVYSNAPEALIIDRPSEPGESHMENRDIAKILHETAQLLEIDGAIIGRYRSYEKVAELLSSMPERIEDLAKDEEKLTELPGVGEGMAEHIREILKTGDYSLRQKLLKKYPPTILELLELQSLGPKKAALLWKKFKVATVDGLEKLAREGKLRDVEGFGEKSEQN